MGKVQGGKAGFVALFLVLAGLLPGCEKGNLMVLLAPPEAVDAGAQWNVDGGDWLDSGATIKKIKAGEHVIGFKPVEGWIAPEDRAAVVVKKKTLTENGVYLPIEPEGEGEPSEAMVPNVAGMSQSNALLALQEAGLLAEIAVQCSMTAAEGTILGQAPPAETVVEVGSTVTLFVSSGPCTVMVPDVTGQNETAANTAMAEAGLAAGPSVSACDDTVPAGNVIGQTPAPGAEVEAGTVVLLTVSSGPCGMNAPDVTGLQQPAAEAAITGAGAVVGLVARQCDAVLPLNTVISQSPAAGAPMSSGGRMDLVVSSGPCNGQIPNVVGLSETDAAALIAAEGFAVSSPPLTQCSLTVAAGSVTSQQPAGGTSATLGSTVTLTVSSGPCTIAVPNVVGQTQAAATAALTGAGLTAGAVTNQCSNTVAAGRVISQTPAAGAVIVPGTAVALTVSTGPCNVTVPNVVGQTQAAATAALTGAGLTAGAVTTQCSNTVAAGNVISQTPAAGASVTSGATVALTVSTGPCNVTVPNVVGQTQAAATAALTGAGLTSGAVTTQCSNTVAAGNVISQNPLAGASVTSGAAVALTVSTGPCNITVPNVVGQTQAAATAALTGAGLTAGAVTTQCSNTVAAGNVISQTPAAGASVTFGATVALMVSTGPCNVTVPNVVGQTQAAATAALTGAGLTSGAVTTQCSNTVAAGNVISQNPLAGASVTPGTAVALAVSNGPCPVTVRDYTGLSQAEAEAAILDSQLTLGTVTNQCSDTVAAGNVISQNPAPGQVAPPGSPVGIVLSTGPCPVTVPNVAGLTQAAATAAITGTGLVVGTVTSQCDDLVPAGSVISQNPVAGTSAAPGSVVSLVVSTGLCAKVPDVVGMENGGAAAIAGAGLRVGVISRECSNTVPLDTVLAQNPPADTLVPRDSEVELTLSSGPCRLKMANYAGMTSAAAQDAILDHGLSVGNITQACSDTVQTGRVVGQSPAVNIPVALNHPVDLVIASGPCPVSVPNVVDMTEAAAGAALQANDLRLGAVTRECTDTAGAGAIIRQNPAAGEAVARGTQVSLAVSEGRCIPSVEVPDFTGGAWPLADALAELDTLGLLKGAVAETCHDTAAPGMIISQNPAPGTMVAEGTEVDFETATGPCGYTLTVAKMGGGHGTVSGGGTDCGAVCSQAHPSGAQVLLTATAGAGSVFAGWTGADETSGNTCLLVMDSDRTVWAQFASAAGNTLVVTKTGNGSGTVTGNGINCGGDCSQTYGLPTNVTLTATPAKGSVFTGFTGHDSEGIFGDNLCAVYVDCVREVTANFTTTPRRLDVVNGGGGTVTGLGINCGGNCSADYSENATVRLSAEPDELHEFVQWIGADNAAGASCTVLMDTDREVTAVFRLKTFTLGMNAEGFGRVNARVTGYYLGCNMHCERQFPAGSMVSLTATPDSGQSFTGWDGVDTQDGTAATVFMDGEREVTAFFSSVQYTLTARSSGEGAVSAPGLSCAASPCSGTYNANQVVLVSASPAEGWRFGGWNGVEDGTANPCAVNMNADRDITAVFLRETVTYPLTVITEGDGLIKVNPLMPGAGCPPPDGCVFTYDAGETASLYALPQAGSLFGGWGGDLAGIIPWGSLIMDGPKTVHAAFVPQSANFTLTVQKSGGGAGTVTGRRIGGAEDEIDCGAACSHSFPSGTTVSLSAVPEAGSVWGGWTGGTAAGTACNVVMSGDKTVTATFLPAGTVKRRLTVQVIGSGSVASTPAGILCGSNDSQAYEFAENTNVTLAATPSSGWSFSSWGMDASGNSGTVTVAMSGDRDVVAYFGTTSTVGFTHDVKYDLLSLKINGADQFTPGAQYIPCGVPPFSFPAQAGQGITVQAGFGVGATGTLYWTHTGTITAPEGGVAAYPPFSLTIGEYLREATIRNGQPLGACVYEGFDDFATPSVTYTLTVNAPAPGVPEFILSGGGQSWSGALSAPLWGCNDQIVKFYFGGNMPAHCNTTTYPQVQMTGGGPIGLHIISPNQVTQRIMAMWKKP